MNEALTLSISPIHLLILFGSAFCFLAALILFFHKGIQLRAPKLLAIVFVVQGMNFLLYFLAFAGVFGQSMFVLRCIGPINYLAPPALYFYVLFTVFENKRFQWWDVFHLLPFVFGLVDLGHYLIMMNLGSKLEYVEYLYNKKYLKPNLNHALVPPIYLFLIRNVQYLGYVLLSWKVILPFRQWILIRSKNPNKLIYQWLFVLVMMMTLVILTNVYMSLKVGKGLTELLANQHQITKYILPMVFAGSFTIVIFASFLFFEPRNFGADNPESKSQFAHSRFNRSMPQNPLQPDAKFQFGQKSPHDLNVIEVVQKDPEGDVVDPEEKLRLLAIQMDQKIDQDLLFLDPELSIDLLSYKFKISRNQMSVVLNKHLGMGFREYINRKRIQYAIKLMSSEEVTDKYTVESIAHMSGFKSRSVFYDWYAKLKQELGLPEPNDFFQK